MLIDQAVIGLKHVIEIQMEMKKKTQTQCNAMIEGEYFYYANIKLKKLL